MKKADLARAIYERHGGISNQEALRVVELIFNTIKERLLRGEDIHIVGFGSLEVIARRSRRGRNPVTGEDIMLPDRRALVFRPSRTMKAV